MQINIYVYVISIDVMCWMTIDFDPFNTRTSLFYFVQNRDREKRTYQHNNEGVFFTKLSLR